MNETARWAEITQTYRKGRPAEPLGEPVVAAILDYLAGQGSADAIRAALPPNRTLYLSWMGLPLSPAAQDALDVFDLRLLELCLAFGGVPDFFMHIARRRDAVRQACAHLANRGVSLPDLLRYLLATHPSYWLAPDPTAPRAHAIPALTALGHEWFAPGSRPTALGRRIQSYLPAHLDTILQHWSSDYDKHLGLARLLVDLEPPEIDRAWALAQQDMPTRAGFYAAVLLEAAPARFSNWAREVVRSFDLSTERGRLVALQALLSLDPARHLDLALLAVQTPIPDRPTWYALEMQKTALTTLLHQDQDRYWGVVEATTRDAHHVVAGYAAQLLAEADFARAVPVLQRAVEQGGRYTAHAALALLLADAWKGRLAYLLTLLAHRSLPIRSAVAEWLIAYDPTVVEAVAPLLNHRSADARLAAVQILRQIGGAPGQALLTARIAVEKSAKVRAAILESTGVPGPSGNDERQE